MLFGRRTKAGFGERLRVTLWPRTSWRRSGVYYLKRVLRLTATPRSIGAGFGAGVFASFMPFIGFHFLIAFALAWILRGNMIAGAIGTAVGNPITFPFIWFGTYQLGHFLLFGEQRGPPPEIGHELLHKSFDQLWPILQPMLVGAIPIGVLAGLLSFVLVYRAVGSYQQRRRQRLAGRRVLAQSRPAAGQV